MVCPHATSLRNLNMNTVWACAFGDTPPVARRGPARRGGEAACGMESIEAAAVPRRWRGGNSVWSLQKRVGARARSAAPRSSSQSRSRTQRRRSQSCGREIAAAGFEQPPAAPFRASSRRHVRKPLSTQGPPRSHEVGRGGRGGRDAGGLLSGSRNCRISWPLCGSAAMLTRRAFKPNRRQV